MTRPANVPSRFVLLGLSLLLASAGATAGTPINETRPFDADGRIEIGNLKGSIQVEAWDRAEVRIEGSLGKGAEKLHIEGDRRNLEVQVKYPNRGGMGFIGGGDRSEPSDLRLMVPRRAELDIESVSAMVDVRGVASRELSIDSVSGAVVVIGAPARVDIDSVSGAMQLTLNSREVQIESVSGNLTLRGRLGGEVHAESVSGRIDIAVHPQARLHELSASTVSGAMKLSTALAPAATVALESVSGSIELTLPSDLSASVRAKSFSGRLVAPEATIERPRHGPGSSFTHRYGAGDAEVTIETFSGDARLRVD